MKKIAAAFYAALLTAVAFALSFFDKGLDGIISQFTKLDAKLDREIAKLTDVRAREVEVRNASYNREQQLLRAEYELRSASFARAEDARRARERAARIKERIRNLTA